MSVPLFAQKESMRVFFFANIWQAKTTKFLKYLLFIFEQNNLFLRYLRYKKYLF